MKIMNNEVKKPNDIFVATLKAPEIGTLDLIQNNITADNTSFLSYDEYKNTPLVKKAFTDKEGNFLEDNFNNAYLLAAQKYADLTDKKAFDDWNQVLEYSSTSIYKPQGAKTRDNSASLRVLRNPLGESIGIRGINERGDKLYTEEESAQQNRIFDTKTNTWLNETPESMSLLKKVLGDTLVYAIWESDGTHIDPATGREVSHYKGQWKTDKDGNYYTETLGNQELLDKKVVSLGDILTKEDSWANKIDFFDSDGYDKSAAGIAAKLAVTMLPYLIPGVREYYGALTAITGLASVMPTFYKSFESILTGDNPSDLSEGATKLENWFRKFSASKSRHGQEGFWNLESLAEMVGDTWGQLYQQRAAASLAKYMKFSNLDSQNKAAKAFSLGYMGLISSNDVYNEALSGGYSKRAAGFASLATASALFGIMNFNESANGLGTWFLDSTTGYNAEVSMGPIKKIAKSLFKDFEKGVEKYAATGEKDALAKSFTTFKRRVGDWIEDYITYPTEGLWKRAIVEGVEEVSEEVIQDSVKGIMDTLSWLGIAEGGSFGGWDNVFSKEGLQRYLATLAGGAMGGALFELQMNHIDPFFNAVFKGEKPQLKKTKYELVEAILDGRGEEVIQELDRLAKAYNTNLGATYQEINGQKFYVGDRNLSQSKVIVDGAKQFVNSMRTAIAQEFGGRIPKLPQGFANMLFEEGLTARVRETGFEDFIKSEYTKAVDRLVDARNAYKNLAEDATKDQQDKAKQDLDNALEEVNGFFNGDRSLEFLQLFNMVVRSNIRDAFYIDNEVTFAQNILGIIDYNSLSDDEKDAVQNKFKLWKDTKGKSELSSDMRIGLQLLRSILERNGEKLSNFVSDTHKADYLRWAFRQEDEVIQQKASELIQQLNDGDITQEEFDRQIQLGITNSNLVQMLKSDPRAITLMDFNNFDIASVLINEGLIDIKNNNDDEELNIVKMLINHTAQSTPMQVWNRDTIMALIDSVNQTLNDSQNFYTKKILELRSESTSTPTTTLIAGGASLVNVDLTTDFNQKLQTKNGEIELSQVKSILNYFSDNFIDKDVFSRIIKLYQGRIQNLLEEIVSIDLYADQLNLEELNNLIESGDLSTLVTRLNDFKTFVEEDINVYTSEVDKQQRFINNATPGSDVSSFKSAKDLNTRKKNYAIQANNLLDQIFSIINDWNNLKSRQVEENPVKEIVKTIYSQLNNSAYGSDIFDLLEKEELTIQDIDKLKSYSIGADKLEVIKSASQALGLLTAAIDAMVAYHAEDANSLYGVNELVRANIELYQGNDADLLQKYPVLSSKDASYIQKYIGNLQSKLQTLYNISSLNIKDKTEEDNKNRWKHDKALLEFYNSKEELKIRDITFKLYIDSIADPEAPIEDQIYEIESRIFEQFNDAINNNEITRKELFAALLQKFNNGADDVDYSIEDAISINPATGNLEYKSHYLLSRLEALSWYSPEMFNEAMLAIYAENKDKGMAPSASQEMALRRILPAIHDIGKAQAFQQFLFEHKISTESNLDANLLHKQLLQNTITLIGKPGTGKTFISKLLKTELDKKGYKIIPIATVLETAENLAEDLGKDKSEAQTLEKLLGSELYGVAQAYKGVETLAVTAILDYISADGKTLNTNPDPNVTISEDKEGVFTVQFSKDGVDYSFTITTQGKSISSIENFKFGTKIQETKLSDEKIAYIIDEATFLNPFIVNWMSNQMDANKLQIYLGDHTQMGHTVDGKDASGNVVKIPYNFDHYSTIMAPRLTSIYRADNQGKEFNTNLFSRALTTNQSAKDKSRTKYGYLSLYADRNYNEFDFKAFFSDPDNALVARIDTKLYGDYITSDEIKFKELALRMKESGSLAIIVNSDAEKTTVVNSIFGDIEDKPKVFTKEEIQGHEYDYIIGYNLKANPGNNNLDIDAQEINMIITRSKKFGLYYESSDLQSSGEGLFSKSGISSREDATIAESSFMDLSTDMANRMAQLEHQKVLGIEPKETTREETEEEPEEKQPLLDPEMQSETNTEDKILPVSETPISEEVKSKETEKEEISSDLKELEKHRITSFNDSSIGHSYHCIVGITRENIEKLKGCNNKAEVEAFFNSDPEGRDNIFAFYNALQDSNSWIFEFMKNKGYNKPEQFLNSGSQLLRAYVNFQRLYLLNNTYENAKKHDIIVTIKKYDENIDFPYLKPNDDPEIVSDQILTVGVETVKGSGESITLLRLGYTEDESKTQSDLRSEYNPDVIIKKRTRLKDNYDFQAVTEYYSKRRNINPETVSYQTGFIQYTQARPYTIKDNINDHLFGKDGYKFNRITAESIKELGWEIKPYKENGYNDNSPKVWMFQDVATLPEENQITEFLNWYNQFRLEPLENTDENKAWVKSVMKRQWTYAYIKNTNCAVPLLVNRIANKFQYKTTKAGNWKLYSVKQALQGLFYQLDKNQGDLGLDLKLNLRYSNKTNLTNQLQKLVNDNNFGKLVEKVYGTNAENVLKFIELGRKAIQNDNQNNSWIPVNNSAAMVVNGLLQDTYFEDFFFQESTNTESDYGNARFSRVMEPPRFFVLWEAFETLSPLGERATPTETKITEETNNESPKPDRDLTNDDNDNLDAFKQDFLETIQKDKTTVFRYMDKISNMEEFKQKVINIIIADKDGEVLSAFLNSDGTQSELFKDLESMIRTTTGAKFIAARTKLGNLLYFIQNEGCKLL